MSAILSGPCLACPYRKDVPSGVWSADEYDKLVAYDAPTARSTPTTQGTRSSSTRGIGTGTTDDLSWAIQREGAMTAEERGLELALTPMNQLPALALSFARRACGKLGMCGEVFIMAYTSYAQVVEGLAPGDPGCEVRAEDRAWIVERKACPDCRGALMVCKWCREPQPTIPRPVELDFLCRCGGEWSVCLTCSRAKDDT